MKARKGLSDGDDQSTTGDDDDYRKKRERNNQAVKRSRVKTKQKTQETENRVKWLRTNNKILEEKIEKHQKDLKFLKDLFLAQAQTKAQTVSTIDLKKLLQSDDEDDDNNQSTSTQEQQ